jgi:hypothetical protein
MAHVATASRLGTLVKTTGSLSGLLNYDSGIFTIGLSGKDELLYSIWLRLTTGSV